MPSAAEQLEASKKYYVKSSDVLTKKLPPPPIPIVDKNEADTGGCGDIDRLNGHRISSHNRNGPQTHTGENRRSFSNPRSFPSTGAGSEENVDEENDENDRLTVSSSLTSQYSEFQSRLSQLLGPGHQISSSSSSTKTSSTPTTTTAAAFNNQPSTSSSSSLNNRKLESLESMKQDQRRGSSIRGGRLGQKSTIKTFVEDLNNNNKIDDDGNIKKNDDKNLGVPYQLVVSKYPSISNKSHQHQTYDTKNNSNQLSSVVRSNDRYQGEQRRQSQRFSTNNNHHNNLPPPPLPPKPKFKIPVHPSTTSASPSLSKSRQDFPRQFSPSPTINNSSSKNSHEFRIGSAPSENSRNDSQQVLLSNENNNTASKSELNAFFDSMGMLMNGYADRMSICSGTLSSIPSNNTCVNSQCECRQQSSNVATERVPPITQSQSNSIQPRNLFASRQHPSTTMPSSSISSPSGVSVIERNARVIKWIYNHNNDDNSNITQSS